MFMILASTTVAEAHRAPGLAPRARSWWIPSLLRLLPRLSSLSASCRRFALEYSLFTNVLIEPLLNSLKLTFYHCLTAIPFANPKRTQPLRVFGESHSPAPQELSFYHSFGFGARCQTQSRSSSILAPPEPECQPEKLSFYHCFSAKPRGGES